jgi:G:T-mismatch repair DNA endonuclease (very short patch repair protein)
MNIQPEVRFFELISQFEPKDYRSLYAILRKDPELLGWIKDQVPASDYLPEQIYCIMNSEDPMCDNGSRRKFKDSWAGYYMCGRSSCKCWRDNQSQKLRVVKSSMTAQQVADVMRKRRDTSLKRYGVEHPMQSSEVKRKSAENNISKYGVKTTLLIPEVKSKIEETLLSRYGVSNPQQDKEIKSKSMASCLSRYGHKVYPHSQEGRERVRATMKSRYNVSSISQLKFSNEVRDLLQDTHRFHSEYRSLGINGLCEKYPELNYEMCRDKLIREGVTEVIKFSKPESFVKDLLDQNGINYQYHTRKLIPPFEVDFYLPDHSLAIEVCGLYWHRETHLVDRSYHLKKLKACLSKDIKLITIFSDNIEQKPEVVRSRLLSKLKVITRTAHARKLVLSYDQPRSDVTAFLSKHHLQGPKLGDFNICAMDTKGQMYAVMTFGKLRNSLGQRKAVDGVYEMYRFAVDGNIPGMASKMFRRFVKDHNPKQVISYSDRCWGEGNLYETIGFQFVHASAPNYWYTKDFKTRIHRFGFTKHSLIKKGHDPGKTEWEIMRSIGYDRIWDCGSNKYSWINPNPTPVISIPNPLDEIFKFE